MDKKTMQNITEASANKWKRLHELEAENVRLRGALCDIANCTVPGWQESAQDTRYLRFVDHARAALGEQS